MEMQKFCCEKVKDGLKIILNVPVHSVKEDLTSSVINFFELEGIVTTKQIFEDILCEIPISTVILTKESIDDLIYSIKKPKSNVHHQDFVTLFKEIRNGKIAV